MIEDKKLRAVAGMNSKHNKWKWTPYMQFFPGRTARQLRDRYLALDSKDNSEEWTQEEDEQILRLYQRIGSKWTLIA